MAVAVAFSGSSAGQLITQLSPEANQAFDEYVKTAETRMDWKAQNRPLSVKNGMIHDWSKSMVAPGASVEKALAVFQDYANYKTIFGPEVADSKLVDHNDGLWHAWLQLRRKKVMTVVLNSEYEIEYRPLGEGRWAILSRSTRISEVDEGRELPPGTGHGFLWRLNAYWLIEPRREGLFLECRSISLSRDIPTGLGWIIRPLVSNVPRESLDATIVGLGKALR